MNELIGYYKKHIHANQLNKEQQQKQNAQLKKQNKLILLNGSGNSRTNNVIQKRKAL